MLLITAAGSRSCESPRRLAAISSAINNNRQAMTRVKLDEFLKAQGSGLTAALEAVSERPTHVKVTPYREDGQCGCSSSFELPREMIRSLVPTGKYHFCCGKRLEVAVVEFAENASVPVADLMKRIDRPSEHTHAPLSHGSPGHNLPYAASSVGRRPSGLVGRWPLPGGCELNCIEVCTRFCGPTGWACCEWETRCGVSCYGNAIA